jgi:hypothetical protein
MLAPLFTTTPRALSLRLKRNQRYMLTVSLTGIVGFFLAFAAVSWGPVALTIGLVLVAVSAPALMFTDYPPPRRPRLGYYARLAWLSLLQFVAIVILPVLFYLGTHS